MLCYSSSGRQAVIDIDPGVARVKIVNLNMDLTFDMFLYKTPMIGR